MSDEKQKRHEVEWSFDVTIENLISGFTESLNAISNDEPLKTESFNEAVDGAKSTDIKLGFSLGEASINAGTDADKLLAAELTYVGDIQFEIDVEDTHKSVKLTQRSASDVISPIKQGIRALANNQSLKWHVSLAKGIPIDLAVDAGLGQNNIDLTGLTLTKLTVDSGIGETNIILPAQDEAYTVSHKAGVGEINITIPEDANTRLDIKGGVGSTTIYVPENTPSRIKVMAGLGSVDVADIFEQGNPRDDFIGGDAIYETAGYDEAERSIEINYQMGIGELSVKTHPKA